MYKINVDKEKNCLYILLKGRVSERITDQLLEDIQAKAHELQPGFYIINDLRETTSITTQRKGETLDFLETMMELGHGRVIRIVGPAPQSDMFSRQLDKLSQRFGRLPTNVTTMEEAEKIIATSKQTDLGIKI